MVTTAIIFVLFSLVYFGSIKLLNEKNNEFSQFLVIYIVMYLLDTV